MDTSKSRFCPVGLLASIRRHARAFFLPFAIFLAVPSFAQAAAIVFVSTEEEDASIIDNAWNAFSTQAGLASLSITDGRGALGADAATSASPSAGTPLSTLIASDTKLIVVMTTYEYMNDERLAELLAILDSRKDLAVVAFIDGCDLCGPDHNLKDFVDKVNEIRPASWSTPIAFDTIVNDSYTAYLNSSSPYATPFSDESQFVGYYFTPLLNVPSGYALYTESNGVDDVTLVVPQQESSGGNGACLFLTGDTSMFDPNPAVVPLVNQGQYAILAKDFINAALDAKGACAPKKDDGGGEDNNTAHSIPALDGTALALLALMLAAGAAGLLRRGS